MENQKINKISALQKGAKIFKCLKSINSLIKESKTRERGFTQLKEVNRETLSAGLLIYYYYLEGKYHSLIYKETGKIEELELANDSYDELIYTARDNGIFIKNTKFLFVRAYCKFQLAKALAKNSSKEYFFNHSKFLTEQALKYNTDNPSFIWLMREITTTKF